MLLNEGDSASSCRHWRNGVPLMGSKGEKEERRRCVLGARHFFFRRPSFSPSFFWQCASFRRERSERAESPAESHENTPTAVTRKSMRNLNKTNAARIRNICMFAAAFFPRLV